MSPIKFPDSYIAQGVATLVFSATPFTLLMLFGRKWREARKVPEGFGTS